jgi:hypothetical protein
MVEEAAELIKRARDELIRQAAQGQVLHNDDTSMKVLRLEREPADERTGVFTSGIVSTAEGQKIALFFTGRQHAGENLADVLKRRATELAVPIQMSDALSRNAPKSVELLVANCLAHEKKVCGDRAELPRGMPSCSGDVGHGLLPRQAGARARVIAGEAITVSPGTQ